MENFHCLFPVNRIPKIPKTNVPHFKRPNMNSSQISREHARTFMQQTLLTHSRGEFRTQSSKHLTWNLLRVNSFKLLNIYTRSSILDD